MGEAGEPGLIFKNRLGFPLDVVEQQKERSGGIIDSIRATMLHEGCKHFEATTMEFIRSSTMSILTLILCQIILKCMI